MRKNECDFRVQRPQIVLKRYLESKHLLESRKLLHSVINKDRLSNLRQPIIFYSEMFVWDEKYSRDSDLSCQIERVNLMLN